jgi:hypothetical protein
MVHFDAQCMFLEQVSLVLVYFFSDYQTVLIKLATWCNLLDGPFDFGSPVIESAKLSDIPEIFKVLNVADFMDKID